MEKCTTQVFPSEWDEYVGAEPIPEDFASFWDRIMKAADEAPLEYEITVADIPSSSTCDFFDLRFTGLFGEAFYAKYLRPKGISNPPLVLQFHGYPGASRSWFEQASFVAEGAALIALDNPGQGGKSNDAGNYKGPTVLGHIISGLEGPVSEMYYARLYQNLRLFARIVEELGAAGEFDLKRIYVNGASQGAALGIAFCALNPSLVKKAALLYPFLSDFRGVWELGADEGVYEGLRYYTRWFDPDGTRNNEWFRKLAYIDAKNFASLVRCPVYFGTALDDKVVPPKCQAAVYNMLSCEKMRLLYPGLGHVEIQDFDDGIPAFFELTSAQSWEHSRSEGLTYTCMFPNGEGPHPVVVQFHDSICRPRGWHHCQRYLAAGYAVVQIENPTGATTNELLALAKRAEKLVCTIANDERVDKARVVFFGEGFGGALALLLASRVPTWKLCALNPYPIDTLLGNISLQCDCLLGNSGMDEFATHEQQSALIEALADAKTLVHKYYPKHTHERVNAFENETLSYLINSLYEHQQERV